MAIAEVRNFYEAKLAEQQVLHESALRKLLEPEAREVLEQEYRRESRAADVGAGQEDREDTRGVHPAEAD